MIKVPKEMSPEELLEALKVMEVLGPKKPDLAENVRSAYGEKNILGGEDRDELSVSKDGRAALVERLSKELRVVPKKKKPKRLSWQKKRANRRAIQRRYQEGRRERVNKEWALKLIEGKPEDLYFWVSKKRGDARYKYQRPGWEITYEEFLEYVFPKLGDRIPIVRRYDTKKGWSLENTIWFDSDDKTKVLFDGNEWRLRQLGYTVD